MEKPRPNPTSRVSSCALGAETCSRADDDSITGYPCSRARCLEDPSVFVLPDRRGRWRSAMSPAWVRRDLQRPSLGSGETLGSSRACHRKANSSRERDTSSRVESRGLPVSREALPVAARFGAAAALAAAAAHWQPWHMPSSELSACPLASRKAAGDGDGLPISLGDWRHRINAAAFRMAWSG